MGLGGVALRARLLFNLKNDSNFGSEASPDTLNAYLTLGQRRMVRDSPGTIGFKRATLSIVATDQQVDLAADVFQVLAVYHPARAWRLRYIPPRQFIDEVELIATVQSGPPQAYTIADYDTTTGKWEIRFDAISDDSYTLAYWYYFMPADISGTGVPIVSAIGFDELLIWAATMIARENNDPEGHAVAKAHYDEGMQAFKAYDTASPDRDMVAMPDDLYERGMFPLDPAHFSN